MNLRTDVLGPDEVHLAQCSFSHSGQKWVSRKEYKNKTRILLIIYVCLYVFGILFQLFYWLHLQKRKQQLHPPIWESFLVPRHWAGHKQWGRSSPEAEWLEDAAHLTV